VRGHYSVACNSVISTNAATESLPHPFCVSPVQAIGVEFGAYVARQVRLRIVSHGNGAMLPLEPRDLARRLLDDEAAADKTSLSTESGVFRVYEKLRWSLSALVGVAGFRSLATRALTLAKAGAPGLIAMQVRADGSLHVLNETESDGDARQVGEAGVILLAQLLGLLHAFIGEALTLRLLRDVWPNAVFDDRDFEMGEKHERTR